MTPLRRSSRFTVTRTARLLTLVALVVSTVVLVVEPVQAIQSVSVVEVEYPPTVQPRESLSVDVTMSYFDAKSGHALEVGIVDVDALLRRKGIGWIGSIEHPQGDWSMDFRAALVEGTVEAAPMQCGDGIGVPFRIEGRAFCFTHVRREYAVTGVFPYLSGTWKVAFRLSNLDRGTHNLRAVAAAYVGEVTPAYATPPVAVDWRDFSIVVAARTTVATTITTTMTADTSSIPIVASSVAQPTQITSPQTTTVLTQPYWQRWEAILVACAVLFVVLILGLRTRIKKTTSRVFCVECGAENPIGNRYCGKCGRELVVGSPSHE